MASPSTVSQKTVKEVPTGRAASRMLAALSRQQAVSTAGTPTRATMRAHPSRPAAMVVPSSTRLSTPREWLLPAAFSMK